MRLTFILVRILDERRGEERKTQIIMLYNDEYEWRHKAEEMELKSEGGDFIRPLITFQN